MRSHNTLRTAFLMIATTTGVTLAAGAAHADVSTDTGAPNVSIGSAALKYEHNKSLDTSIDTGMHGFSALSNKLTVQVGAAITIDPVKNGGPLFTVDMPKGAIVQASWANDKKITLKAMNGSSTDGNITVRHTLSPTLKLGLSIFSVNVNLAYSATDLLNKLQDKIGANAQFNYDSRASQAFAPWGFAKVDTKLNAPDLTGAELFTLPMSDIQLLVDNNFDGDFGVRATTNPTFSYTTKKVTLSGADGTISAQGGEVTEPAVDGDFMESMVNVEGEMDVSGTMNIQPFVSLTKVPVLGNVSVDIPINAYSAPYTVPPTKCTFQSVVVHIPLPNVHAPKQGVDLGSVKAGGSATKTVTIQNSGEKAASMTFKSSDPQFTVPSGTINIEPKGSYDMQIKFSSANAGAAAADITVLSNDPDSPEQTFKIGANGADVGGPGDPSADLPSGGQSDSGCGCTTAGSSSLPSWAGFGLLGLGTVVFARRRKNAR
jgi:MYXO-CTERM domain-containing protein